MAQCLSYPEEEAVVDGSDAKSEHKKVQHAEKGTKKSKKGDQPAVKLSRAGKAKLKLGKDAKTGPTPQYRLSQGECPAL